MRPNNSVRYTIRDPIGISKSASTYTISPSIDRTFPSLFHRRMTRMGAMGTGGGSSLAQQLQGMRPGDSQGADGGIGGSSSMPGSNAGRPPRPGSAAGRDPVAPRLAPIDPNAVGHMAPGPGSYGGFGAAPGHAARHPEIPIVWG